MAMHDGASDAIDHEAWLTADRIAELSSGRVKPNTVRSWWRTGALEFEVFPELGAKSNKRSRRDVVERFLRRKLGDDVVDVRPGPAAATTRTRTYRRLRFASATRALRCRWRPSRSGM